MEMPRALVHVRIDRLNSRWRRLLYLRTGEILLSKALVWECLVFLYMVVRIAKLGINECNSGKDQGIRSLLGGTNERKKFHVAGNEVRLEARDGGGMFVLLEASSSRINRLNPEKRYPHICARVGCSARERLGRKCFVSSYIVA